MEECLGLSRTSAGLTLLELVVAMVVVVILATIAYPSYQDNLRKGRRAAAQSFLIETASRQQQYLLDARSYAVGRGAIAALNLTVPPDVAPYYTVTVEPAAPTIPPTYRIVATPIAVLTALDQVDLHERAIKSGARAVVLKAGAC